MLKLLSVGVPLVVVHFKQGLGPRGAAPAQLGDAQDSEGHHPLTWGGRVATVRDRRIVDTVEDGASGVLHGVAIPFTLPVPDKVSPAESRGPVGFQHVCGLHE